MKKLIFFIFIPLHLLSQININKYVEVKHTSIKDQKNSGTCWIYATLSFLESEIIRKKHIELDLSEQFINYYAFTVKAQNKLKNPDKFVYTEGGFTQLVFDIWKKYGIVLDSDYPSILDNQTQLNSDTENFLDSLINNEIPQDWLKQYKNIIENYFGLPPEFTYFKNKKYTPLNFAKFLDINFDDYVFFTSFKRQPFYKFVSIDFNEPYDWTDQKFFNVPIDTLLDIMETALKKGYTVVVDLSLCQYFKFLQGIADMRIKKDINIQDSRDKVLPPHHKVMKYDHIMHIVGLAQGNGKKYFYTKNSWGTRNLYQGYMYISYDYFKTLGIYVVVHKKALKKSILAKMINSQNYKF